MATVEELIKRYETDEGLQKDVADILADGKVSIKEFMDFKKKYDLDVSITELPKYIEEAKKLGLIK